MLISAHLTLPMPRLSILADTKRRTERPAGTAATAAAIARRIRSPTRRATRPRTQRTRFLKPWNRYCGFPCHDDLGRLDYIHIHLIKFTG